MERIFTWDDQLRFAKLSLDFNPIHVDPVLSRRLLYGQVVVHGLHGVLWALNEWCGPEIAQYRVESMDVSFLKPIFIATPVALSLSRRGSVLDFKLTTQGQVATRIKAVVAAVDISVQPDDTEGQIQGLVMEGEIPVEPEPMQLEESQMIGLSGGLKLGFDPGHANELGFSPLMRTFGGLFMAELLGLTRLVGMKVPGYHSVFSGFKSKLTADAGPDELRYHVLDLDARFHQVEIEAKSPSLETTVKAFIRPGPTRQPSYGDLLESVQSGEFHGTRALVVGGSRGLGELAAKAIAAGGGQVMLTYRDGAAEADAIVQEIKAGGGLTQTLRLDVGELSDAAVESIKGFKASHVLYFATPFITSGQKGNYSPNNFRKFLDFYVDGFFKVFELTRECGTDRFFYPSTVFLEELPLSMVDYALAKGAGETLCSWIEKNYPQIKVSRPRLPKMATDQTAGLMDSGAADSKGIIDHLLGFMGSGAMKA